MHTPCRQSEALVSILPFRMLLPRRIILASPLLRGTVSEQDLQPGATPPQLPDTHDARRPGFYASEVHQSLTGQSDSDSTSPHAAQAAAAISLAASCSGADRGPWISTGACSHARFAIEIRALISKLLREKCPDGVFAVFEASANGYHGASSKLFQIPTLRATTRRLWRDQFVSGNTARAAG